MLIGVKEESPDVTPEEHELSVEIPCLWFFLPLPHPLGLPTGWRSQWRLPLAKLLRSSAPISDLASSLLIHQLDPSVQPVLTDMADLMLFGAATMTNKGIAESGAALLDRFANETGGDLRELHTVRTIAEVAIPGLTDNSHERVIEALDLAIDHVRFVQRAVALATQEPIEMLSRARLPPTVPTFTGVIWRSHFEDPTPKPPEVRSSIDYFVPGCAPPTALGLRPDMYSEEILERIFDAQSRLSGGAAFDLYADLRREATVQRRFGGNNRMALVALATAGEVLLDTALLHMLWEEHAAPPAAARYFDRNEGHTARVARYFPPRLGGGWDSGSKSPAGAYLRELVRLRHRVVHAGHEPTTNEIEGGWTALFVLEHYLGDRLAAGQNLKRYTRTAMAWMAESGLRRRNRWTRHVEALVSDPSEPNWVNAFARWRHHVDRALHDSPQQPAAHTDDLILYADLLDDGTIRWLIHDAKTAHAALVDPTQITSESEIATVTDLLAHVPSEGLADRRMALSLNSPIPSSLTWQPDHELFPELQFFPATATAPPAT